MDAADKTAVAQRVNQHGATLGSAHDHVIVVAHRHTGDLLLVAKEDVARTAVHAAARVVVGVLDVPDHERRVARASDEDRLGLVERQAGDNVVVLAHDLLHPFEAAVCADHAKRLVPVAGHKQEAPVRGHGKQLWPGHDVVRELDHKGGLLCSPSDQNS